MTELTTSGAANSAAPEFVLEARGIVKRFGHVSALRGASLTVRPAEVVALLGDNGAGKSTLVKTISGVIRPDGGQILFDGVPVEIQSPNHARELGIETVYQDLALAHDLDPAANLFLGRELVKPGLLGKLGILDDKEMSRRTGDVFKRLGVAVQSATTPVVSLSGGQRQGVAVSRAVLWASRVVIMDEPTAALGVVQTRAVRDLIRRVRDSGRAVVLISHNIPEVFQVADRIEVMRQGRRVGRFIAADTTTEDIVASMTGALVQEQEL
jgi:simple sugar transport system ATP-binding protein